MSAYVRWFLSGGTYFFTLVTERRAPLFADALNRQILRTSIERCRSAYAFDVVAIVLLPDHLHLIMTLPEDDANFSIRLRWIKSNFTDAYLAVGGEERPRSESRERRGNRGVWQRRFHEHLCRDANDLGRRVEYAHFNPVKHGLVRCPHAWPHSSFHRWVAAGRERADWCCVCDDAKPMLPDFSWGESLE